MSDPASDSLAAASLGDGNLAYVEALYADYLANPQSVDPEWREHFASIQNEHAGNGAASSPAEARRAVEGPSFQAPSIFNPPSVAATTTALSVSAPAVEIDLDSLPQLDADVLQERVRFLRELALFRDIPDSELELAARLSTEETHLDGYHLIHRGESGDVLYLLMQGTLVVRRQNQVVATLEVGDVAGELAVLDRLPRSADVFAHGPIRVMRVERDALMSLIERRPALARGFIQMLSRRLRQRRSRQDKVNQLIHAYRVRGHLQAEINPLGPRGAAHPELDLSFYDLTEHDLESVFSTTMIRGTDMMTLGEIIERMHSTYCRSVGVQFMHIDDLRAKDWLLQRLEDPEDPRRVLSRDEQLAILTKLTDAEYVEQFLGRKFLGKKRFSLEGAETLIPLLELTLEKAGNQGIREVVLGMAHRGRLNVLINVMGKRPSQVFREFRDDSPDEQLGGGDVKYHLGYSADRETPDGGSMHLSLCFNPSHLEFVDPVVLGRVRAKQDRYHDTEHERGLGILIHGDAAFCGQGVVQELLNLGELHGYRTGGTVHIVVNNQIGFTTTPESGRSTSYTTDVARMLQTPIFHVNGEDPEAVAWVVRLAMDYRHEFKKDVIIDMYCYRRHGHNEGDEPSYTQPLMYKQIKKRKSVRDGYLEHLLGIGEITQADADEIAESRKTDLERELTKAQEPDFRPERSESSGQGLWKPFTGGPDDDAPNVPTSVDETMLRELLEATIRVPEAVNVHPKLKRLRAARGEMAQGERPLDWAGAEAAALASLVAEGNPVRFAGQDSGRGTFSHRHAVYHDHKNGEPYIPLQHVADDQGRFHVWDSPLSEVAVLGFEYGYSLDTPDGLVVWEAQFGDFCNVAQVIIDQFITSSEDKWRRLSGLVMLLPHGFEGQGPEHSSARLERFLSLCAEDNIQVVNLTTPAQYFHCLRRQVKRPWRKPLVVMSPKSLLRHPEAVSDLSELATGEFRRVLPDTSVEPGDVAKILLCSGKVYYDLVAARRERERKDLAIVRLEQYYPLGVEELKAALEPYKKGTPVVWVQEEPENMGAMSFVRLNVKPLIHDDWPITWVHRPASASPATGSKAAHDKEQALLMEQALG